MQSSFLRGTAELDRDICAVKYKVVMKDERESGLREVLNLGHTVGLSLIHILLQKPKNSLIMTTTA